MRLVYSLWLCLTYSACTAGHPTPPSNTPQNPVEHQTGTGSDPSTSTPSQNGVNPTTPEDNPNIPPNTQPCPEGSVRHRDGIQCLTCTPSCADQTGSSGNTDPRAAAGTECVCQTRDGFFLSPGENGRATKIVACDEDGDGWVRDTVNGLEKYVFSPHNRVLFDNNRCRVHLISFFEIRDEWGHTIAIEPLQQPLPMIESLENDTDAHAHALTKACVSSTFDLNKNGLPDIDERHEEKETDYLQFLYAHSSLAPQWNDFTYFRELYTGFFEEGLRTYQGATGGTMVEGHFVIQERPRAQGFPTSMRLQMYRHPDTEEHPSNAYGYGGNNYWRFCTRFQDQDYTTHLLNKKPLHNLDFMRHATHASVVFERGYQQLPHPTVGHQSQFKCVQINNLAALKEPYSITTSEASRMALNTCPEQNLDIPCHTVDPIDGFVGFAAVPYEQQKNTSYPRGCINEYFYFKARCQGYDTYPESVQGDGDESNFGKLLCGCSLSYGGPFCNIGCPNNPDNSMLFTHPDYRFSENFYPSEKRNYWMCGSTQNSFTDFLVFSKEGYSIDATWSSWHSVSPYTSSTGWTLQQGFFFSSFYRSGTTP